MPGRAGFASVMEEINPETAVNAKALRRKDAEKRNWLPVWLRLVFTVA